MSPLVGKHVRLWQANPDRSKWPRALVLAVGFDPDESGRGGACDFYALVEHEDGRYLATVALDGSFIDEPDDVRKPDSDPEARHDCGHYAYEHPDAENLLKGAAERDGRVCSKGWPL